MFSNYLNGYATHLAHGMLNFHGCTVLYRTMTAEPDAAYKVGAHDADTTCQLLVERGFAPVRAARRLRLAARRRARNRTRRHPRSSYGMQIRGRLPELRR